MRRTRLFGIGIAVAVCIAAVLLAVEIVVIPGAWAKKPDNGDTGGPSTIFGYAYGLDGAITSSGGEVYTDCRVSDNEEVEVEIELDGKDQVKRLVFVCGPICRACGGEGRTERTVNLYLQGQEWVQDPELESGSTGEKLLVAITGILDHGAVTGHVVIQARLAKKNDWVLLVQSGVSEITRGILYSLKDQDGNDVFAEGELDRYKFWEDGDLDSNNDRLDLHLVYQDAVNVVKPLADGWCIDPSSLNVPVRLYVMKKGKGNNPNFWQPEFLATYNQGLPFEMTVTADPPVLAKPSAPPASPSTWGQVKEQFK
jgi:hypothetical protein